LYHADCLLNVSVVGRELLCLKQLRKPVLQVPGTAVKVAKY